MSKLFLRPVGGFGARMIPLLQVMSAIERESSHSLVVCWPLHTTSSGGRAGSTRERVFPLSINDFMIFRRCLEMILKFLVLERSIEPYW